MTGLVKVCLWTMFAVGVLALLPLPFVRTVRHAPYTVEICFRCLPLKVINIQNVSMQSQQALWVHTRIGDETRVDFIAPTKWRRIR